MHISFRKILFEKFEQSDEYYRSFALAIGDERNICTWDISPSDAMSECRLSMYQQRLQNNGDLAECKEYARSPVDGRMKIVWQPDAAVNTAADAQSSAHVASVAAKNNSDRQICIDAVIASKVVNGLPTRFSWSNYASIAVGKAKDRGYSAKRCWEFVRKVGRLKAEEHARKAAAEAKVAEVAWPVDSVFSFAKSGDTGKLNKALHQGTDIDETSPTRRQTLLIVAARHGHLETVSFLASRQAKLNEQDADGFTALSIAAKNNHATIVRYLIKHGANTHLRAGQRLAKDLTTNPYIKKLLNDAQSIRVAFVLEDKALREVRRQEVLAEERRQDELNSQAKFEMALRDGQRLENDLDPEGRRQIQHGLVAMGFHKGTVDGILGMGTRRSISAYQKSLGELETGYLSRA